MLISINIRFISIHYTDNLNDSHVTVVKYRYNKRVDYINRIILYLTTAIFVYEGKCNLFTTSLHILQQKKVDKCFKHVQESVSIVFFKGRRNLELVPCQLKSSLQFYTWIYTRDFTLQYPLVCLHNAPPEHSCIVYNLKGKLSCSERKKGARFRLVRLQLLLLTRK